jgi:hypothetical protein
MAGNDDDGQETVERGLTVRAPYLTESSLQMGVEKPALPEKPAFKLTDVVSISLRPFLSPFLPFFSIFVSGVRHVDKEGARAIRS